MQTSMGMVTLNIPGDRSDCCMFYEHGNAAAGHRSIQLSGDVMYELEHENVKAQLVATIFPTMYRIRESAVRFMLTAGRSVGGARRC